MLNGRKLIDLAQPWNGQVPVRRASHRDIRSRELCRQPRHEQILTIAYGKNMPIEMA
jgi:hypothetical protein